MRRLAGLSPVGLGLVLGGLACAQPRQTAPAAERRAAAAPHPYVFVHGAWGGGWDWRGIDSLLRVRGYPVSRVTLTGLGERVHLARADVGLSTHVADVVNHILYENLRDVVLVGHSYGGMVITGVAEQVPDRIRHLVYIDAVVPEDGESLVTAARGTGMERGVGETLGRAKDGFLIPGWVKSDAAVPHDVPHPVKTFTEPVSFRNAAARRIPGTYILTIDPGATEDAFSAFAERARGRGWIVHVMRADHVPERSAPVELSRLLQQIP